MTSGDVGLLDGQGYADYRFEFDLELPRPARAWPAGSFAPKLRATVCCFNSKAPTRLTAAPQWKTRPNTLRPHVRRGGEWTLAEPVALPKPVRRGESHHLIVECRGPQVTVWLDGDKVLTQGDAGMRAGTVGFRAAGPPEQGLFRNISLHKLD